MALFVRALPEITRRQALLQDGMMAINAERITTTRTLSRLDAVASAGRRDV
ncbi:MAG: hypothetical protein WA996_03790 [Candidatus Promineifilaceae bacterium]